jgi:hypothetical protein
MAALLFRCPTTRHIVQGWLPDDPISKDTRDTYESMECLACGGRHLVNAKTGKTLGDDKTSVR